MDMLLSKEELKFSVDEIYHKEREIFEATIIPDMNTEYFFPYHLRTIRFNYRLLEKQYYYYLTKYVKELPQYPKDGFSGSIKQGGYYKILKERILPEMFRNYYVFDNDSNKKDIFKGAIYKDNPHVYVNYQKEIINDKKQVVSQLSSEDNIEGKLFFYGFNVGQGDTLLIICPNKSAYLIDSNIYGKSKRVIDEIKDIFKNHNIKKIKALIITHKHLDHIRGVKEIINNFDIEHFIINHDYEHHTKPVNVLLKSAEKIPVWINCNKEFRYNDGKVKFNFLNPTSRTNNNNGAPEINDSSICMYLEYEDKGILLTGDASYYILNKITRRVGHTFVLKVSHHGSRTGTNDTLCQTLKPIDFSFISAGTSKRYNHPHQSTLDTLSASGSKIDLSKDKKRIVEYIINETGINRNYI